MISASFNVVEPPGSDVRNAVRLLLWSVNVFDICVSLSGYSRLPTCNIESKLENSFHTLS